MSNLFSLEGKTAIVTGSGSGIGQAIAVGMAEAGAQMVLVGRTMSKLETTSERIKKETGADSFLIAADVTNSEQVGDMVAKVVERFGRIDILINNAGINIKKPFLSVTEEDWRQIINTNLTGQFLVASAVAKQMVEQNYGKIVNMASVGGFMALSNTAPYCASKGGILQMTKVMASDLSKYNINVNAICPGYILTGLLTDPVQKQKIIDTVVAKTPMNRPGTPNDLIGAAIYLVSDSASYVTGTQIVIDGGMSAVAI